MMRRGPEGLFLTTRKTAHVLCLYVLTQSGLHTTAVKSSFPITSHIGDALVGPAGMVMVRSEPNRVFKHLISERIHSEGEGSRCP